MKTQKMSLANIKGKLSRAEMKNIMAGSADTCNPGRSCEFNNDCGYWQWICYQIARNSK